MITAQQLRTKFLDFFREKDHAIIPSASLIPDNDPTTLFITAGMHPLVPYLLGQPHPAGRRLADIQKCMRTVDIEEVGDRTHFTFFEMLGNWSLGDYFKRETINWSWEFLTDPKWLGLNPEKLFVSVFTGDTDAPRDEEAAQIWQEVLTRAGVSHADQRLYFYPKSENWWGPAGQTGPCGPDTEIFYYTGDGDPFAPGFADEPAKSGGEFVEIWNNVFMQYNKMANGTFEQLAQKNVDTGLGLERMVAILNWLQGDLAEPDPYLTDLFRPMINQLERSTARQYSDPDAKRSMRIITDHLRSALFIISDGVVPANKERGYVLRRLIRRAVREIYKLNPQFDEIDTVIEHWIQEFGHNTAYATEYPELSAGNPNLEKVTAILLKEVNKFIVALRKGLLEINKLPVLDGKAAFDLYQSYGFPLEMSIEIAKEKGQAIDATAFAAEFAKHQDLSRTQSSQTFKGGLADHSEQATRYHTATHLLHAALRRTLGDAVHQEGSNITAERLRFDFTFDRALTDDEIEQVETWINEQIRADRPVTKQVLPKEEALASGALAFFKEKYPDMVTVYTIGDTPGWVSRELCGGPHVSHTGEIGPIKIFKQKPVSAEVRRIYLRFC